MTYDPYDDRLFVDRELRWRKTSLTGLIALELPVVKDGRGWSKETYNGDLEAGLPRGFSPVRWASNASRRLGTTRGIHAELANKLVSLERGELLAVIVDFRAGRDFGRYEMIRLTVGTALLIPAGCGNSYQTLTDDVHYAYLTDRNIAPRRPVTTVSLADPALAIPWPIPLDRAIVLEEDQGLPNLDQIEPLDLDRLKG
ncbi:MAG: dTDP-4-dehydrorhamnose 3,5-epimerase [Bifidobacteriaceae bacterium]|nr:dTDP-4-dehydrorhamnose 3,5-epimerase [Bifidobacteriaceae bacterium]